MGMEHSLVPQQDSFVPVSERIRSLEGESQLTLLSSLKWASNVSGLFEGGAAVQVFDNHL